MTVTENLFINLVADEGMELWNGEISANRVSMPLGSDTTMWVERIVEPIIEEMTLEELQALEAELLLIVNQ